MHRLESLPTRVSYLCGILFYGHHINVMCFINVPLLTTLYLLFLCMNGWNWTIKTIKKLITYNNVSVFFFIFGRISFLLLIV